MRSFDEPCGIVAGRAVLAHRRVLPQHRAAHLGVAADAALGDGAADLQCLDVADRTVRVVARRAGHLAFAHRHVRDGALGLGDLQRDGTSRTLRLRRFDELLLGRLRTVHAVTGGARQIARVVRAAFPAGMIAAVVARQARLADSPALICANFRMCPLASSSTCACPGPWQLSQPWPPGERGFFACACACPSACRPVGVARDAGVASGVAGRRRLRSSRHCYGSPRSRDLRRLDRDGENETRRARSDRRNEQTRRSDTQAP